MQKLTVEGSIWIDAPRKRVWQALIDPAEVVQWFLPALPGAQMEGNGNKLAVVFGPMSVDVVALEAMMPPRQVTTRGLPDGLLTTDYVLEEENGGTRVKIAMRGFEELPEDAAHERLEQSRSAWADALQNLKAYVEERELPFPYAAVAPLFGYWRKGNKQIAVERSIWIAAPRKRVWQAITDPKQIEQWFSPGTEWRLSALEIGGKLSVYRAETDSESDIQTIELLEPPRQFVTRTEPTADGLSYVSDWKLAEENGGTRLTLTYSGYELTAEEDRQQSMEQNAFGFGMMMMNLQAYVEGNALPSPGGF